MKKLKLYQNVSVNDPFMLTNGHSHTHRQHNIDLVWFNCKSNRNLCFQLCPWVTMAVSFFKNWILQLMHLNANFFFKSRRWFLQVSLHLVSCYYTMVVAGPIIWNVFQIFASTLRLSPNFSIMSLGNHTFSSFTRILPCVISFKCPFLTYFTTS